MAPAAANSRSIAIRHSENRVDSCSQSLAQRLREYSQQCAGRISSVAERQARGATMSAAASAALAMAPCAEAAIRYSGPVNLLVQATGPVQFPKATFAMTGASGETVARFGISAAWFGGSFYNWGQVGLGTVDRTASASNYFASRAGALGEQIAYDPGSLNFQVPGVAQPTRFIAGRSIGPSHIGFTVTTNSLGTFTGARGFFGPPIYPAGYNKALAHGNNSVGMFGGDNWPNPGGFYPIGATDTTGFAGVRFDNPDGNGRLYGWVRLAIDRTDVGPRVGRPVGVAVRDWAFETSPDTPLEAGAGAPELPGDVDVDGDVDGADLLHWQRRANPTAAELQQWKSNFGSAVPPLASVPEPGATTSLTLALLATGARGVRTQRRRRAT